MGSETILVSGIWNVPAGVTSVRIEGWGGGGPGSEAQNRGGGGAAYARKNNHTVTPGDHLHIVIGSSGVDTLVKAANDTTIIMRIKAGSTPNGGSGAQCTGADNAWDGGSGGSNGGDGDSIYYGAGGGAAAGDGCAGANGGISNGGSGLNGGGFGGTGSFYDLNEDYEEQSTQGAIPGGGGGSGSTGSHIDSPGGAGKVIITWSDPASAVPAKMNQYRRRR